MIPKAMDSLDLVEAVMLIEEVFGTEIPDGDAEIFGSPRDMMAVVLPMSIFFVIFGAVALLGGSSARIFMRQMLLRLGLLNKRVRRGQGVWFFSW